MQYSNDGRPLKKFDAIKDAAQAVGMKSTSIIGALRGKQDNFGRIQMEISLGFLLSDFTWNCLILRTDFSIECSFEEKVFIRAFYIFAFEKKLRKNYL